jgi:hypothetical protein
MWSTSRLGQTPDHQVVGQFEPVGRAPGLPLRADLAGRRQMKTMIKMVTEMTSAAVVLTPIIRHMTL